MRVTVALIVVVGSQVRASMLPAAPIMSVGTGAGTRVLKSIVPTTPVTPTLNRGALTNGPKVKEP